MTEMHVGFTVRRLMSKRVKLSGLREVGAGGVPDASITVGDTTYHVHLQGGDGRMLTEETRQEAIALLPDALSNPPPWLSE